MVNKYLNQSVVDVSGYGTKGDGTTNDTIGINAAATAAGSTGCIFFPAGTYIYNGGGLTSANYVIGAGRGITTLKLAAAANGDLLQFNGAPTAGGIAHLTLDGNKANQTSGSHAILWVNNATDFTIEDVTIQNGYLDGCRVQGGGIVRAVNFRITSCRQHGLNVGNPGLMDNFCAAHGTLDANGSAGSGFYQVFYQNMDGQLSDCTLSGTGGLGPNMRIFQATSIEVHGCLMVGSQLENIVINGGSGSPSSQIVITGNNLQNASLSASGAAAHIKVGTGLNASANYVMIAGNEFFQAAANPNPLAFIDEDANSTFTLVGMNGYSGTVTDTQVHLRGTGSAALGALVALGGGANATLSTIGGSGPATAGQNSWMRFIDTTGAIFWVPVWK